MNKFEFKKIMQCLGYTPEEDGSYLINGCRFSHDGHKYFTRVYGNISSEFARFLFEKYDNSKYKIRVEGSNEYTVPVGNIHTYHIDTIEGLVAFILELKNNYVRNVSAEELDETLQMVYKKILLNVDADVNISDWMLDRENRKEYFKPLFEHNTLLDLKLRKKIVEFDNIVNPFCDNQLDMNDNSFVVNGNKYINGESWYSLTDKESGISLYTNKVEVGFVVKLFVPRESYEVSIYHYFDVNGEVVAFEKYDYSDGITRLQYNITRDTFGKLYDDNHPVTVEDKKFIIKRLDEYIAVAKEIVNKNTGCKTEEKSPVLRKTK